MPEQVTAWKDNAGTLHASEEEANTANKAIEHKRLRERVAKLFHGNGDLILCNLEGFNHDTLQPLADYIAILIEDSKERTRRFG